MNSLIKSLGPKFDVLTNLHGQINLSLHCQHYLSFIFESSVFADDLSLRFLFCCTMISIESKGVLTKCALFIRYLLFGCYRTFVGRKAILKKRGESKFLNAATNAYSDNWLFFQQLKAQIEYLFVEVEI